MKAQLLLTAFFTVSTADSDFFQNYVQNYLNHTIKPCDDFFGHVCSSENENVYFMVNTFLKMLQRFGPHFSDHCKEILKEYLNSEQITPVTFSDDEAKRLEIRMKCSEDLPRCQKIVQIYRGFNAKDLDEAVEMVLRITLNIQDPLIKEKVDIGLTKAIIICAAEGLHRQIAANTTVLPEIKSAEARIDKLLPKLKNNLIEKFNVTKWMRKSKNVKKYQELVKSIPRKKFYNKAYEPKAVKAAMMVGTKAKECLEVIFRWHPQEVGSCLMKGFEYASAKMNLDFDNDINTLQHMDVLNFNAFYHPLANIMGASAALTLSAPTEGISQLASIGFVLIHELSHAVFGDEQEIKRLPIENIECVKEHRRSVCANETYFCKMGDPTISEDAADIMGFAAALDILEQEKDQLEGNPVGFTKEQFFFYTMTATFCTNKLDHQQNAQGIDPHSPRKGRMNALLMHSEVFQEAFSCKEGDRMWRKPSQFCHLLGPDAHRR